MELPSVKNTNQVVRRQTVNFGGLNLSDGAADGELSACTNLSARRFPLLAPRKGRRLLAEYGEDADAFVWDGKQAVVSNGVLYYDGEAVDNVTPGKKQWAVVNTKLCIFPDKIWVDLTNRKFGRMDGSVTLIPDTDSSQNVHVTDDSIKAEVHAAARHNLKMAGWGGSANWNPAIYTYGADHGAVAECWDPEAKTWTFPAGMEKLSGFFGTYGAAEAGVSGPDNMIGQIFIPELQNNAFMWVYCDAAGFASGMPTRPDRSLYNQEGYYGVITGYDGDWVIDIYGGSRVRPIADIYQVGRENPLFSAVLEAGDVVNITGTPYGLYDRELTVLEGIDDETNTLRFAKGTFRGAVAVYGVAGATSIQRGKGYQTKSGDMWYYFSAKETMQAGQVLLLSNDKKTVFAWDPGEKRVLWEATVTMVSSNPGYTNRTMTALRFTQHAVISRDVPDLDFICESGNRLWGVSNNQKNRVYNSETKEFETYTARCIYASALGTPWAFWQLRGNDSDSYQLAVGSEGDFTAICEYGDGVCCWKEQRLHRILGSYPSEYYMSERALEGVEKGSDRSLVNLNETLYYKGRSGVYAYGGGQPVLMSENFGAHRFRDAVAGTDGTQYFISMREGKLWYLLAYDTVSGLWLQEDDTEVAAFCVTDGRMNMLRKDGAMLETGLDGDHDQVDTSPAPVFRARPILRKAADRATTEEVPILWSATFAPFTEGDGHERKNYLRVLLRMEQNGGSVTVSVKRNGEWTDVKTLRDGENTAIVPIWPGRVDRLELRLTGTAPCTILSMAREFLAESIYGGEDQGR